MKKSAIAARIARQSRVSKAAAADELDRVVHKILTRLRSGRPAALPGLGTFTPGQELNFHFDPPRKEKNRGRAKS